MTKNKLVEKVLSGAKKIALGASILGALYSNNVNAQKTSSNIKEGVASVDDKIGKFQIVNLDGVSTYLSPNQDIDQTELFPGVLSLDMGGKHFPAVIYTPQIIEVDGGKADALEIGINGEEKFKDLLNKVQDQNTTYDVYSKEIKKNLHTINISNKDYAFFALSQDTMGNTAESWKKLLEEQKEGKLLGFLVPLDKMEILRNNKGADEKVKYSVVSHDEIYGIKIDDKKSPNQDIDGKKAKLNDNGRSYILDTIQQEDFKKLSEQGKIIYVNGISNLPYLDGGSKQEKEKAPSNFNGRIKLGAGVAVPKGFEVSINPQVQLGEKAFLGSYFSFSNSTRSLENMTQEDGFKQVLSVPAQMYFVSTGTEIKENTKVTNNLGLGLNFSYIQPSWEAFIKAGILGQKTEKTMQSSGEEYIEIAGVKDPESVQSYNEINNSTINKSLFKGSPVYIGAGAEYFPLKGKKILENFSVAGEFGYVTGENSGPLGSVGIKYNLRKTQNKSKE